LEKAMDEEQVKLCSRIERDYEKIRMILKMSVKVKMKHVAFSCISLILLVDNVLAQEKTPLENISLIVGIVVSIALVIIAYLSYKQNKKKKSEKQPEGQKIIVTSDSATIGKSTIEKQEAGRGIIIQQPSKMEPLTYPFSPDPLNQTPPEPNFVGRELLPSKPIPIDKSVLYEVTTSNELYELIEETDEDYFIEKPFRFKDWKSKRVDLFYFGEESTIEYEIKEMLDILTRQKILPITGPPNVGKTTFLLFFLDECLRRNLGNWEVIFFLNPDIGGLQDALDQIDGLAERYGVGKVLLVIDALKRIQEDDIEYKEKCKVLFDKVYRSPLKCRLIFTFREDEKNLLRRELGRKWHKYSIEKEKKLELDEKNFKRIKRILIKYLKYYKVGLQGISFDDPKFNNYVRIISKNSQGSAGYIAALIEHISREYTVLSEEAIKECPKGMTNLFLDIFMKSFYQKNDELFPLLITTLAKLRYPVTEFFFDSFKVWGIKEKLTGVDEEKISARVNNLRNFYTILRTFEGETEYRLLDYWKEGVYNIVSYKEQYDEKYKDIVNKFKYAEKNWKSQIKKNYLPSMYEDLETRSGLFLPKHSDAWYLVGDIAKLWNVTDINALKSATDFFKEYHQEYAEFPGCNFLKNSLSRLWKKVLNEASDEDCDFAIGFYNELTSFDSGDYWPCWMLGEFYEKINKKEDALNWYIKSAVLQNTLQAYGRLMSKIKSYRKMQRLSEDIEREYLDIQEKAAIKTIELDAINLRNWNALGDVLKDEGRLFKNQREYWRAIGTFDNAIKVYEKGMKIGEKLQILLGNEKISQFYGIAEIADILSERAHANELLGQLEEAISDLDEAIEKKYFIMEIVLLPNAEEDINRLSNDKKRIKEVKRILKLIKYICHIADVAIDGKIRRDDLSERWYGVKILLDDVKPKWIDKKYLKEFKISALCQSINNKKNTDAENALKRLTELPFDEIKEIYTAKNHYEKSLKEENKGKILEIFHRIFSAAINTMIVTGEIRDGGLNPEEEKEKLQRLSREWGETGIIASKFSAKFTHKVAIKCFELSLTSNLNNFASWHNLGWENFNDGRFDDAYNAFEKNLEIEEKNKEWIYSPLSKIGIGKIYEERGNVVAAAKCFKDGANLCMKLYSERDPQRVIDSLMQTGKSLEILCSLLIERDKKIGFLKDAIKEYKKALDISLDSNNIESQTILVQEKIESLGKKIEWLEETGIYPKMSLSKILEASLDELLSIDTGSENIIVLNNKGFAFSRVGKEDEAIVWFDKALKLSDYKHVPAWINKGFALSKLGNYKLGNYKEAIKCFDKAINLKCDYTLAWYGKGLVLNKMGLYPEAIMCFDEILTKLNPKYVSAWNNKGLSLIKWKRPKEAIECCNKAIDIKHDNSTAWNYKGLAFENLKEYEKAIECYDEALKILESKSDNDFALSVWSNKGHAYENWGDEDIKVDRDEKYENALECYERALEIKPDTAIAWNNKGRVLKKLGRHNEALGCLKIFSKLKQTSVKSKGGTKERLINILQEISKNPGDYDLFKQVFEAEFDYQTEKAIPSKEEQGALRGKFYNLLFMSLWKASEESPFETTAKIFKSCQIFCEDISGKELKDRLTIRFQRYMFSFFRDIIFGTRYHNIGPVESKEELNSILDEFERTFGEIGIETPSLEEIKKGWIFGKIDVKTPLMSETVEKSELNVKRGKQGK
jgi:tetratricopeptide (TPR) repeat protein